MEKAAINAINTLPAHVRIRLLILVEKKLYDYNLVQLRKLKTGVLYG